MGLADDQRMTAVDRSGLDPAYFDTMAAHATTHWWYRARSEWVTQELGGPGAGGTALDAGCGVGATLRALRSAGYDTVLGVDVSPYVLQRARDVVPGQPLLAVASAEEIPVADGALRCVASLDVLEHLVDDVAALREYARVVAPGGRLLLMTPAYQWLFSDHDRWANHHRRYSARRLTTAVRAAGLEVERSTYVFSFLVPAAAILRRTPLRRWLGSTDEETSSVSPLLNRVLAFATRVERQIGRVVRIPFGLSVLVIARVPGGDGAPDLEPGAERPPRSRR